MRAYVDRYRYRYARIYLYVRVYDKIVSVTLGDHNKLQLYYDLSKAKCWFLYARYVMCSRMSDVHDAIIIIDPFSNDNHFL